MNKILKTWILAGTLAGCVASAGVGYHATVVAPAPAVVVETPPPPPPEPAPAVYVEPAPAVEVAYVEPTSYVYINPQVQVIEDYDYPVFVYGGLYWRQEGGVWYSSSYHDRGWIVNNDTPTYIRTIDRPTQYVHYRGNVNARPGQIGYRGTIATPVRHVGPPPRAIEQPGHPVVSRPPPGGHVGETMPPGHGGEPPGHGGMPPGHPEGPGHAMPPGHGGEPPGHGGEPPGHAMGQAMPPGHGGPPPGHPEPGGAMPPGHGGEPPGHGGEPPGQGHGGVAPGHMGENVGHGGPGNPQSHAAPPPPSHPAPPASHGKDPHKK